MTSKEDTSYTHPELREKLKEETKVSDKAGRSGQWSARKSQLLTKEYEKAGGDYKGEKTEDKKSLEEWTEEEWSTQDEGERAYRSDGMARYLPKEVREKLSPEAITEATKKKEREGSTRGEQYLENPEVFKEARKEAAVPLSNYDGLTVAEAKNELEGLSDDELRKVRAYEEEHKNRKTLLEQLDRKIGHDGS